MVREDLVTQAYYYVLLSVVRSCERSVSSVEMSVALVLPLGLFVVRPVRQFRFDYGVLWILEAYYLLVHVHTTTAY